MDQSMLAGVAINHDNLPLLERSWSTREIFFFLFPAMWIFWRTSFAEVRYHLSLIDLKTEAGKNLFLYLQ